MMEEKSRLGLNKLDLVLTARHVGLTGREASRQSTWLMRASTVSIFMFGVG